MQLHASPTELAGNQEIYNWPNFGGQDAQKCKCFSRSTFIKNFFESCELERRFDSLHELPDSMIIPQEVESTGYPAYSSRMNTSGINQDCYQTAFAQGQNGISLQENLILKKKFTIREISPHWCYAYEAAKVYSSCKNSIIKLKLFH